MNLALEIKESLYEQGLKKHQEMVTQNTELQKQLEVTMREGKIQEGNVKKLQTALRVANERRTQAKTTLQELLIDPLNTPTSIREDGEKWKKEIDELKGKLEMEALQRTLLTQVFLDKEKAADAKIKELEKQLAVAQKAKEVELEPPLPAPQFSAFQHEGSSWEAEVEEIMQDLTGVHNCQRGHKWSYRANTA